MTTDNPEELSFDDGKRALSSEEFDRIHDAHRIGLIYELVKSFKNADIEAAVQEAFLALACLPSLTRTNGRFAETFEEKSLAARKFLSTVAKHKCIDQLRKMSLPIVSGDPSQVPQMEEPGLVIGLTYEALEKCLRDLKDDERTLFMSKSSGNSYEEISRELKRPAGPLRQAHAVVRKKLRACVDRHMRPYLEDNNDE